MNVFAWDQILLIIGLIVVGVFLVIARRPVFDLVMSATEEWLPSRNLYSQLGPSPLFFGALSVLMIAAGVLAAASLAVPGFEMLG